ncbi:hypothetical protein [Halomonas sp. G11]|uniref:hypothetical protein n=1 Tax=Halomonas sp. G11 TaxID=1684425 RepID=UPI0018FEFDF2|nr:hypothetical protein [Halomonas sp. G11]
MNLYPESQERLRFLSRVVDKELKHLEYADHQVFGGLLTYDAVEDLDKTPELAMKVEAFVSRFCRCKIPSEISCYQRCLKHWASQIGHCLLTLKRQKSKVGWHPLSNGSPSGNYATR